MDLLKTYFRYLKNPAIALQGLLEKRSLAGACVGYLAAALGWVIFFNTGDGLSVSSFVLKTTIVFVAELTTGYFIASLSGLFLDLFRLKVTPSALFILVGSAGFIKGLLICGALISAAFPAAKLAYFSPLWLLLVLGLQLAYLTRGLSRVSGLSAWRALGAWLSGFIPVGCAFGCLFVFFIWGILLSV